MTFSNEGTSLAVPGSMALGQQPNYNKEVPDACPTTNIRPLSLSPYFVLIGPFARGEGETLDLAGWRALVSWCRAQEVNREPIP